MAKKSFAERIKDKMSEKVPKKDRYGEWYKNHKTYAHILNNVEKNFLEEKPKKCDIKGDRFDKETGRKNEIKYHTGASSLNSSQAMCINFFKKFFDPKHEERERYLLRALKAAGVRSLSGDEKIKSAIFEYVPDSKEYTNFDFFIELDNESHSHISMEIKYTENEFSSHSFKNGIPEKYDLRWKTIYQNMINECSCPVLRRLSEIEFFENYQINRNICYATKEDDIVLFITPKHNDAKGICRGRDYIDSFRSERIVNMYWEELVEKLMELVEDVPELHGYYSTFKEKYIDVIYEACPED